MDRMRQGAACAVLLVFCGITAIPASADERDWSAHVNGSMRKLGRGIANVATCPAELIRVPSIVGRKDGLVAEATVGVAQGLWKTVVRGVTGVYEVVTFPLEIPEGFEPIVKPEYVWADSSWQEE